MNLLRPFPPEHLVGGLGSFEPAPDVLRWARATFINEGATVENPDHEHLREASIGFLWTNEPNEKKQRTVLGMCALMPPTGDKWSAGRANQQLEEWFVEPLDFLITLYAPRAAELDDASFMALCEHELYHCAQKVGSEGPVFNGQTGKPAWAIRGHDVEQFVGVVRRYGAMASGVSELVEAAINGPEIVEARISLACGNCLRAS